MRRPLVIFAFILLVGGLALFLRRAAERAAASTPEPTPVASSSVPPPPPASTASSAIAAPAAETLGPLLASTPALERRRLGDIAGALEEYRSTVKDRERGPPAVTNAELTARLRGANVHEQAFLPATLPLNSDGELLDTWGRPYFFHAESAERVTLRSGGPDGRLWTEDDLMYPPPPDAPAAEEPAR